MRIVAACFTIFASESLKFLFGHVLRPLLVTNVVILADRLIKPLFAAIFNGLLQPGLILVYNIAVGTRLAVGPVLDVAMSAATVVAKVLGSIRLISLNYYGRSSGTVQNM